MVLISAKRVLGLLFLSPNFFNNVFKVCFVVQIMVFGFEGMAAEFGINVWVLSLILIWSAIWKLAALWKAARRGSLFWFIALALINTVGILEILYIFVFSEMQHTKLTRIRREKPEEALLDKKIIKKKKSKKK